MIIGVRKMRPRVVLQQPPVTGTKMRTRLAVGFGLGLGEILDLSIGSTRLGVDKVKPKGWFKFFLTDK